MSQANKLLLFAIVVVLTLSKCHRRADYVSPAVSRIENRVMDSTNMLSTKQKRQLFEMIEAIEDSSGAQVAVVIVQSLKGADINRYSLQVAEKLALGRYEYDDGVLLTLALQERSARIEVGIGLEGILRDEIAARILRESMIPEFSEGRIFDGLGGGIREIGKLVIDNREQIRKRS